MVSYCKLMIGENGTINQDELSFLLNYINTKGKEENRLRNTWFRSTLEKKLIHRSFAPVSTNFPAVTQCIGAIFAAS